VSSSHENDAANFCGLGIYMDGSANKLKFVGGCNTTTSISTNNTPIMSLRRGGGVEIHAGVGLELSVEGDIESSGSLTAITKNFVHPHPTDPSKEIQYVCLEGPENGTYFRGSASTTNGVAIVELPEHFSMVTKSEGITVQVTAMGPAKIWVENKNPERLVVRSDSDVEFDYFINGLRKGFENYEPIKENTHFVPRENSGVFAEKFPSGIVEILQQNSILNEDQQPNIETAKKMNWDLNSVNKTTVEQELDAVQIIDQ
jgi:hypothetical protein